MSLFTCGQSQPTVVELDGVDVSHNTHPRWTADYCYILDKRYPFVVVVLTLSWSHSCFFGSGRCDQCGLRLGRCNDHSLC
jgi:hypothetical protein